MLKAVWNFIKNNAVALLSAIAAMLLEWWFHRPKPAPSAAQSQADRSIGALDQRAKDEQQAASEVPSAVWPTGDKSAVIEELRKDGVIK